MPAMVAPHCQQSAGFLIKEPCRQSVDAFCHDCRQAICRDHSRIVAERILCLDCTRLDLSRNHDPLAPVDKTDKVNNSDPYFYSYRHYGGADNKLTSEFDEKDRAEFDSPANDSASSDEEFEQDFGGS